MNTRFTFFVRHEATKHIATFVGEGAGIAAAFKDGYDNLTYGHINPSSSGGEGANMPPTLAVHLPDGRKVNMKREDFEDGKPFTGIIVPNPAPKTAEEVARATAADPKRGAHL